MNNWINFDLPITDITYYVKCKQYEKDHVVQHRKGFDNHNVLIARGYTCYCLPADPVAAFAYLIDPPRKIPMNHILALGNYILNYNTTGGPLHIPIEEDEDIYCDVCGLHYRFDEPCAYH
jgi:hypothetical protein